jgi:hypothetical protein
MHKKVQQHVHCCSNSHWLIDWLVAWYLRPTLASNLYNGNKLK